MWGKKVFVCASSSEWHYKSSRKNILEAGIERIKSVLKWDLEQKKYIKDLTWGVISYELLNAIKKVAYSTRFWRFKQLTTKIAKQPSEKSMVLYTNIDLKLRNKSHGPMHYKIGVTCVYNEHVIYTLL